MGIRYTFFPCSLLGGEMKDPGNEVNLEAAVYSFRRAPVKLQSILVFWKCRVSSGAFKLAKTSFFRTEGHLCLWKAQRHR